MNQALWVHEISFQILLDLAKLGSSGIGIRSSGFRLFFSSPFCFLSFRRLLLHDFEDIARDTKFNFGCVWVRLSRAFHRGVLRTSTNTLQILLGLDPIVLT